MAARGRTPVGGESHSKDTEGVRRGNTTVRHSATSPLRPTSMRTTPKGHGAERRDMRPARGYSSHVRYVPAYLHAQHAKGLGGDF